MSSFLKQLKLEPASVEELYGGRSTIPELDILVALPLKLNISAIARRVSVAMQTTYNSTRSLCSRVMSPSPSSKSNGIYRITFGYMVTCAGRAKRQLRLRREEREMLTMRM
ncbi:hypothetical protein CSKR_111300 [Clonorchis sinensis]|uniref:Uncharacterized protein n=1 Tax=Clonorchis sinensis TaxID=79923 RepID=A0A419PCU1_CLOSI|nr:hypothetical protein CSKR_111300 [Clonorchis sinensis]